MQQDQKSKAHLRELKWFIDQFEEYQTEQHSVLKSIPLIGPFLQECCTKEVEDDDGVVEVPFCLYHMDQLGHHKPTVRDPA